MTNLRLPFIFPLLLLLNLHSIGAVVSADPTTESSDSEYIRTSCGSTLYPDVCYTSLSRYASAVQSDPGRLARVAIAVNLSNARKMASYLSNLTREGGTNTGAASALHDCVSNLGDAVDEIEDSLKQMRDIGAGGASDFRFKISNVQTWMSAALTDEETCTDGFEDVPEGDKIKEKVLEGVGDVKKLTSNAVALVNNYASKGTPRKCV
ncbi:21 kDa protein-like [Tripterygium wilfordii]|uniref:21 kDa protein-like n=1 Tax=Tripterygium wilfordii TaxID=458696 RepID=UPI0018F84620|nr:21 kDa protein-like [Tripterygium wilfordii]XP_038697825.1 21 kDa protein-like [Tripterygium wilfordii]